MSKHLFIQADPKIRIHGGYSTGAAQINRARSVLYMHLLEDSAYNIQVSRKKYTLAPGVECIATHEYGQTYLDIYSSKVPENARLGSHDFAAYCGFYITNNIMYGVGTNPSGANIQSYATFNSDGSVKKLGTLLIADLGINPAACDFLGNQRVGVVALLLDNLTDTLFNANARGFYFCVIDTATAGVISQYNLGLASREQVMSCNYIGYNTVVILTNIIVLTSSTTSSTVANVYLFNFVTNTLTLRSTTNYQGTLNAPSYSTCLYAGGMNVAGNRVLGSVALGSDNTLTINMLIDKNNNMSSLVYSNVYPSVPTNPGQPVAIGFTSNNDPVGVAYNDPLISPDFRPAYINALVRVFWGNGVYDFTAPPQAGISSTIFTRSVKIIPFGSGVLIFTDMYAIYFANGVFVSSLFLGGNISSIYGTVDFCNTKSKMLYNLSMNGAINMINAPRVVSTPTNIYATPYSSMYAWFPVAPGDWLDYPSVYI